MEPQLAFLSEVRVKLRAAIRAHNEARRALEAKIREQVQ